ncbi:hypothetical protein [Xenorhabdus ishibashii]|uniref:Uncharacterized protein n=1 Tax=Xenorhabdus ishibashii TaxID=1034471 RepID=A0A2D0K818_9GAMM|nr:hypothetical protein [Xenorhabdus ishibashii]PHM59523.1 hypothetical protein Xish_03642 [Xenorhabdus ishibashii]
MSVLKNKSIDIPVSLIDTLFVNFKNIEFTFFSILTFAKSDEIDEWKQALNSLLNDNAFILVREGTLSDIYRLNDSHSAIKRLII